MKVDRNDDLLRLLKLCSAVLGEPGGDRHFAGTGRIVIDGGWGKQLMVFTANAGIIPV